MIKIRFYIFKSAMRLSEIRSKLLNNFPIIVEEEKRNVIQSVPINFFISEGNNINKKSHEKLYDALVKLWQEDIKEKFKVIKINENSIEYVESLPIYTIEEKEIFSPRFYNFIKQNKIEIFFRDGELEIQEAIDFCYYVPDSSPYCVVYENGKCITENT